MADFDDAAIAVGADGEGIGAGMLDLQGDGDAGGDGKYWLAMSVPYRWCPFEHGDTGTWDFVD